MALLLRLSAVPLLALAACSSPGESGPLKIGELYQCFETTHPSTRPASNYYLRFTDEDTVLNTVSDQTPAEIRTWFHKGEANVNSDKYELQGSTITITYDLGAIYQGTIDGDRIFFNVTLIDGPPFVQNYALVE